MISINTDYTKTSFSTIHTKNMLKTISNKGFTHIHWVHQWNGTDHYTLPEMQQIKGWLKEFNLSVHGIHASDGTITGEFDDRKMFISPNEYNRRAGVELVKNRIDLASFLDAKLIVLHIKMFHLLDIDLDYSSFVDTYWDCLFKSFDSIIEYAKEKNIKVAIENLEFPSNAIQFDQFDRMFERYSVKNLGFCFDLGHGMICNYKRPFEFLEKYQNRLIELHLNCGIGNVNNITDYRTILKELDLHNIPNEESVNLNELAKIIARSSNEVPITFEIATSENEVDSGLTETLRVGKLIEELVAKAATDFNTV